MESKYIKGLLAVGLFSTLILSAKSAEACTGFVIGKDLTEDGYYLFGRTEDYPFQEENAHHEKNFIVHEATQYTNGEMIHDGDTGFTYPHAESEMKYTSVPDADRDNEENLNGTYGEHGFNEAGVSMSATVTASPLPWNHGNHEEIAKVDPFTKDAEEAQKEKIRSQAIASGMTEDEADSKAEAEYTKLGGIGESSITDLVLPRAKTAREGVEILAKVLDEKGAYDGNIVMIADAQELWYMEIVSRHQYVAIKYPSDKFSVMTNTWFLGSVDFNDKENVIASKDIIEVAKKAGTDTYDKDGKFLIARSYGPSNYAPADQSRAYAGIKWLDPDAPITYEDTFYDLFHSPTHLDHKFSIQDVMALQRNRFEHLPQFKPDDAVPVGYTKQWDDPIYKYSLGNKNVVDPHFYQINTNLPAGFGGVAWMGLGQSRNTPYFSYYGNIVKTSDIFHHQTKDYDPDSWYWVAQHIDSLASAHPDLFGKTIQGRWKALEKQEIKRQNDQNTFYETAGLTAEQASDAVTQDFLALTDTIFKEMKLVESKMEAAIKGDRKALAYLEDYTTLPELPALHLYRPDNTPPTVEKPTADISNFKTVAPVRISVLDQQGHGVAGVKVDVMTHHRVYELQADDKGNVELTTHVGDHLHYRVAVTPEGYTNANLVGSQAEIVSGLNTLHLNLVKVMTEMSDEKISDLSKTDLNTNLSNKAVDETGKQVINPAMTTTVSENLAQSNHAIVQQLVHQESESVPSIMTSEFSKSDNKDSLPTTGDALDNLATTAGLITLTLAGAMVVTGKRKGFL